MYHEVTKCDKCVFNRECYKEGKLSPFLLLEDTQLSLTYGGNGAHGMLNPGEICNKAKGQTCFIVAYAAHWCQVEPTYFLEKEGDQYNSYVLYGQYNEGLARRNAKFGDIICYNNRFWGVEWAKNAGAALKKFIKHLKEYQTSAT